MFSKIELRKPDTSILFLRDTTGRWISSGGGSYVTRVSARRDPLARVSATIESKRAHAGILILILALGSEIVLSH